MRTTMYTAQEIVDYAAAEDVKFIRLAFCDVFGVPKNISIMPEELPRAFSNGISIDASAIRGFGDEAHSDLLLFPDAETIRRCPGDPATAASCACLRTTAARTGRSFRSTAKHLRRMMPRRERGRRRQLGTD